MDLIRDKIYEKTGGFMKGICHPRENYKMVTDAGINWVRRDPPLAIDKDGNVTESHKRFMEETRKAMYGAAMIAIQRAIEEIEI